MSTGQCRRCMRRREVFAAQRLGGGTYRRRGRFYWSSICGGCAAELLTYASDTQRDKGTGAVAQWTVSSLLHVVRTADKIRRAQ